MRPVINVFTSSICKLLIIGNALSNGFIACRLRFRPIAIEKELDEPVLATLFIQLLFRPTLAHAALNRSSLRATCSLQNVPQAVTTDYVSLSVFSGMMAISSPGNCKGGLASRRQYAPVPATSLTWPHFLPRLAQILAHCLC